METLDNRVLVVDDEKDVRWLLSNILSDAGYEVRTAGNGFEALEALASQGADVVILDAMMPEMNGMEALEKIHSTYPDIPVIILTAHGEIKSAVQSIKLGAYDYLTKPFMNENIILTVQRALEKYQLAVELKKLKEKIHSKDFGISFFGTSKAIEDVMKHLDMVANTNLTVLLQGETGTGKEIVANLIHKRSDRREQPFVAIDCGALPPSLIESELFGYEKGAFTGAERRMNGCFQKADRGTLFLDEIGNLSIDLQQKLLRTFQQRTIRRIGGGSEINIDVRIIAAMNRDLKEEVAEGRFRSDLYHRMNEFTLVIPPLRERTEDIPVLAKYFLDIANEELNKDIRGFSREASSFLLSNDWPGNVRELKNAVRRAVLICQNTILQPGHFDREGNGRHTETGRAHHALLNAGLSLPQVIQVTSKEVEKKLIRDVLKETGGNKSRAAKKLKINYKTLYVKLKKHSL